MKITAEPRSDQWNAEDFIGGSRVFTIAGVRVGSAEQKYDIDLVEGEGRCWRPPLTMLRLLITAWSDDASTWVGRRVELYNDPSVTFGPNKTGGIRIAALSHIDKPLTANLTVKRGQRKPITVQPLPDVDPAITRHLDAIANADSIDDLKAAWENAGSNDPRILAATNKRKAELTKADGQ